MDRDIVSAPEITIQKIVSKADVIGIVKIGKCSRNRGGGPF
jgi:hypothetical protein